MQATTPSMRQRLGDRAQEHWDLALEDGMLAADVVLPTSTGQSSLRLRVPQTRAESRSAGQAYLCAGRISRAKSLSRVEKISIISHGRRW